MSERKNEAVGTITTTQAAKLLMVSEAWIGKLHKMEYVPKKGRGKWNLIEVVQGYIRFLKDEDRRSSKSAAQSRMTDIKAERLELQIRAEKRELVPYDDTRVTLDTAAGLLQSTLMSIPARYTRDLKERKRLEDMISDALNTISDGLNNKAKALKDGDDLIN